MLNILEPLDETMRNDHCLNNRYSLFIETVRYNGSDYLEAFFVIIQTGKKCRLNICD